MKRWKLITLAVVVGAQALQPDRSSQHHDPAADLITIAKPSAQVEHLLRIACYDCHSDSTRYPWYSYFTPVNFWQQDHINEGRDRLNFSAWRDYSAKRLAKNLKKIKREIAQGDMPLPSYTWMHGDARLSDEDRKMLIKFFDGPER